MKFKIYRVRVYVGPTAVNHYAQQARMVGYTNLLEGTEHIHADVLGPATMAPGEADCFRQQVCDNVYGTPMAAGWRQVEILR
jgi:hypothetical protein